MGSKRGLKRGPKGIQNGHFEDLKVGPLFALFEVSVPESLSKKDLSNRPRPFEGP